MTRRVDGPGLVRAVHAAVEALRVHRADIDRANVYPVPDGDTGTNMVLTMESALTAVESSPGDAPAVSAAIVRGTLMGARGNSGVILAQFLAGLLDEVGPGGIDGPGLVAGLRRGATGATRAILDPVEGTILTVARGAADAAEAEPAAYDVVAVATAAAAGARESLASTPELLPVLRRAGVVDAGGWGLSVVLDALAASLSGAESAIPAPLAMPEACAPSVEAVSTRFPYEVMYLLDAPAGQADALRRALGEIGDSVVVIGAGGTWNVHVHTADPSAAVALGSGAGRPWRVSVVSLLEQVARRETGASGGVPLASAARVVDLVAVATGEGVRALFDGLGARVLDPGSFMNPSVGEFSAALEASGRDAIVLCNNLDAEPAARKAAELTAARVEIVATPDMAAGLAAALAFEPGRDLTDNLAEIGAALARVRTGRIAIAARDAHVETGEVLAGQAMGITVEGVVCVASSGPDALRALVEHLGSEEPELVTILWGRGVPEEEIERARACAAVAAPGAEIEVHAGGMPVDRYLVSVE